MRAYVLIGFVAGVNLLNVSANAQEKFLDPIPITDPIRVVPPEAFVGGTPGLAVRLPGTRGVAGAVYDNIQGLDGYYYFGYTFAPHVGDDVSLVPGNQSGLQPQLLNGMDLVFGNEDLFGTGRSFDIAVSFWDTQQTGPGGQAYKDPLGGFRVSLNGLPAGFWTIGLDLSGLPGGGIQLTDSAFCLDIAFYEVGTTTYVNAGGLGSVTAVYRSPTKFSKAGLPADTDGFSMPWCYFDSNGNGICETAERLARSDTMAAFVNVVCAFYGDVRCAADFNNDGFVDPMDYNAFISVFASGSCQ